MEFLQLLLFLLAIVLFLVEAFLPVSRPNLLALGLAAFAAAVALEFVSV